jgi:DNA-binding NtrC family response regulator
VQSIAPEALLLLSQYAWPGNVRELQSAIREALLRSSGVVLLPEFLSPELRRDGAASGAGSHAAPAHVNDADWQTLPRLMDSWLAAGDTELYRRGLEHFDRLLISRALQHAGGNQTRVAEILGMSRATLRAKLRAMGLSVEKVVTPHQERRGVGRAESREPK